MQPAVAGVRVALKPVQGLADRVGRIGGKVRIGPVGLELGEEKLHLVQMEIAGDEPRIRAAVSVAFDGERDALLADRPRLKRLVASALGGAPFRGRRAVTCMPADAVRLSLINYRVRPDGDEAVAVMEQAMERIDGGLDEWVVDYVPVGTRNHEDGERAALLALARRARVLTHLDRLRDAGLEVAALEIGPVAIRRLVTAMRRHEEEFGSVLVMNFGTERSYLTVLSGRRLILDRDVSFGESALVARLATALELEPGPAREIIRRYGVAGGPAGPAAPGVDAAEISRTVAEIVRPEFRRLVDEVSRVLVYLASQTRGASVDQVLLLGSIARWPGAEDLLNGLLALPVAVLDSVAAFEARRKAFQPGGLEPVAGIAVATGCALRMDEGDG